MKNALGSCFVACKHRMRSAALKFLVQMNFFESIPYTALSLISAIVLHSCLWWWVQAVTWHSCSWHLVLASKKDGKRKRGDCTNLATIVVDFAFAACRKREFARNRRNSLRTICKTIVARNAQHLLAIIDNSD
jgi:hypothetical protein